MESLPITSQKRGDEVMSDAIEVEGEEDAILEEDVHAGNDDAGAHINGAGIADSRRGRPWRRRVFRRINNLTSPALIRMTSNTIVKYYYLKTVHIGGE